MEWESEPGADGATNIGTDDGPAGEGSSALVTRCVKAQERRRLLRWCLGKL